MRIAIVGGGIAGMTAGHLLSPEHEVVLYEAAEHIGGHTNTVDVSLGDQRYAIDTGFIVYNEATYPNFCRLLQRLGVATQASDMSFSVSCRRTGLEYSAASLEGFFAQRRNLFRVASYRLLLDILRFNRKAKAFLRRNPDFEKNIYEFCREIYVSQEFIEYYLRPMLAAIWSTDPKDVANFPAAHFLRFFENHGLLNVSDRPQWRVIQGGSRNYVGALTAPYRERIRVKTPVRRILRSAEKATVVDQSGHEDSFDRVVLALHSDQALRVLDEPSPQEREILGAIRYTRNEVALHTDISVLPKDRDAWASWNYLLPREESAGATLSYNMNRLQSLKAPETFCVTLNQTEMLASERILARFSYEHPIFDVAALRAQQRHGEINGQQLTHYCGAYWGYGFHEDGVNSALAACAPLGADAIE